MGETPPRLRFLFFVISSHTIHRDSYSHSQTVSFTVKFAPDHDVDVAIGRHAASS